MEKVYANEPEKIELIARETFFCGIYLPQGEKDFLIKDRSLQGVNYLRMNAPYAKHLSINTMEIPEKRIRKVKEIRHFVYKTSVFKNFIPDSQAVLDAGFESDKELCKIPRFVKDEDDRANTFDVLRKYYSQLKN